MKIGERPPVFNVRPNQMREFGVVDVTGRQTVPGAGPRIPFAPTLTLESSGGPMLDIDGNVVGILGASLKPGARFHHKDVSLSPALWNKVITPPTRTRSILFVGRHRRRLAQKSQRSTA